MPSIDMSQHAVRRRFRPYRILYPFSISCTSTSTNENLHCSTAYRSYFIFIFFFNAAVFINRIMKNTSALGMNITLFHFVVDYAINWVNFIVTSVKMFSVSRKNKIMKLIAEIVELDECLGYVEDGMTSNLSTLWSVCIVSFHGTLLIWIIIEHDGWYMFPYTFASISCDSEITCLVMFTRILSERIKYFNCHLNALLSGDSQVNNSIDILLCYKRILHILKRITTIWELQIIMAMLTAFYCGVRAFIVLVMFPYNFKKWNGVVTTLANFVLVVQHVSLFFRYGTAGQRLGAQFDRLAQLVAAVRDSDLDEQTRMKGEKMARLQDVSPTRLAVMDSVTVDGLLPLRALSAGVSIVIVALQLGFKLF